MSAKRHNTVVLMTTAIALVVMLAFGAIAVGAAAQGTAEITAPAANAQVSGTVVVTGTATATDFQFYKLEFRMGSSPGQWSVIGSLHETQVTNGTLGTWDVSALPSGAYTLRLTVVDNTGNYSDYSVSVTVSSPGSRPTQPTVARPTATSTRSAQPITDLVLVPLAVRPAVAPPGSPPDRGIIRGRVLEASGRGVYGQVVKVTRSGFQQTATTGGDGSYEIAGLEPGTYSVVVERQICTPAEGLNLPAGQALQVDFVQIPPPSPTASPTASPTGTREPSPGVTATPTPLPLTTTVSPTPTPHSAFVDPLDVSRWWDWLGLDLDLDWIASYLYLGIAGGFLVFALGVVITLVRR
ncbi:MAG: carboxypeptidase-like regulatory domain-containing protein [Chloroflexota bacterium]